MALSCVVVGPTHLLLCLCVYLFRRANVTCSSCSSCVCSLSHSILVLLSSFKPTGSSILSVTIYPSDFGLERIAREEVEGPVGFVAEVEGEELSRKRKASTCKEGKTYSEEKMRQYQLSRLK